MHRVMPATFDPLMKVDIAGHGKTRLYADISIHSYRYTKKHIYIYDNIAIIVIALAIAIVITIIIVIMVVTLI